MGGGKWQDIGVSEELDRNLFVYGSLVPGGEYWGQFCEGRVVARRKARVWGRLYRTRDGYLAMAEEHSTFNAERLTFNSEDRRKAVESDEVPKARANGLPLNVERSALKVECSARWIPGWVLTLRDVAALRAIDGLEGFAEGRAEGDNEYQRVRGEFFAEDGPEPEVAGEAWGYVMTAGQLARAGAVFAEI